MLMRKSLLLLVVVWFAACAEEVPDLRSFSPDGGAGDSGPEISPPFPVSGQDGVRQLAQAGGVRPTAQCTAAYYAFLFPKTSAITSNGDPCFDQEAAYRVFGSCDTGAPWTSPTPPTVYSSPNIAPSGRQTTIGVSATCVSLPFSAPGTPYYSTDNHYSAVFIAAGPTSGYRSYGERWWHSEYYNGDGGLGCCLMKYHHYTDLHTATVFDYQYYSGAITARYEQSSVGTQDEQNNYYDNCAHSNPWTRAYSYWTTPYVSPVAAYVICVGEPAIWQAAHRTTLDSPAVVSPTYYTDETLANTLTSLSVSPASAHVYNTRQISLSL